MFRFGLNDEAPSGVDDIDDDGSTNDACKTEQEDNEIAMPGRAPIDEARFGMADPTSVSELRFRDISALKLDPVRGGDAAWCVAYDSKEVPHVSV